MLRPALSTVLNSRIFAISRPSTALTRSFTSTPYIMAKQEWLVILPDRAGGLEDRMKVRPQHLEAVQPLVKAGSVVLGGATLDEPLQEGSAPKINGSVMIYVAETEAEVQKAVQNDVYFKTGVWDASKVQIIPFKSAVRVNL